MLVQSCLGKAGVDSCHPEEMARSLPALAMQYGDFASWQSEWLPSVLDTQLAYWRGVLGEGGPAALDLPTDFVRPNVHSFRGASVAFNVSADVTHQVQEECTRHHATLYMALLAAFGTVLSRNSRQESVCIGSPYAGRDEAGTRDLVGYFVNILAIVVEGHSSTDTNGLLTSTRRTVLGAFEHSGVPFHLMVEALKVERDASRTPVFQAMFVLQDGQADDEEDNGDGRQTSDEGNGTSEEVAASAKFELTLSTLSSKHGSLVVTLTYNVDLFDEVTAGRWSEQLCTGLRTGDVKGDKGGDVPALSRGGGSVALLNAQKLPLQSGCEASTCRFPCAIALLSATESVSYDELARRARCIAEQITYALAERLVGLCMHKGVSMLATICGVLTAGCAYVPLDPEHPTARLVAVIRGAGLWCLVLMRK